MGGKKSKHRAKNEPPKVSSVDADQLIPYDHGDVPMDEVSSIILRTGDYMIWNPVGTPPETKSKARRYLSICWTKKVYHYPIYDDGNKVWILPDRKFKDVATLVDKYVLESIQVDKKNPDVRLRTAVNHRVIKLAFLGQLGKGNFGEVLRGQMDHNGKKFPVAIKRLKQDDPDKQISDAARDEFLKESRLMRHYKHQNIVQLYCVTFSDKNIMIVMELVDGGSLQKYLTQHVGFTSLQQLLLFTQDAGRGMAYLETQKCIHRDLAARNCMLTKDLEVKIGDFGLSRIGEQYKMDSSEKIPWRWTAPEALKDYVFSNKSDVWSFGVLVFEIFSEGTRPYNNFPDSSVLRKELEKGYRLPRPDLMSDAIYGLMMACHKWNPEERPTFAELDITLGKFQVENREEKERRESKRQAKSTSQEPTKSLPAAPSGLSEEAQEMSPAGREMGEARQSYNEGMSTVVAKSETARSMVGRSETARSLVGRSETARKSDDKA